MLPEKDYWCPMPTDPSTTPSELPTHKPDWPDCGLGMTNFDLSIDDGLEEKLKSGKFVATHSAWNFCGYVWFQAGKFHEQVWQWNSPREILSADNLQTLMNEVNEKYGSD